LDDEYTAMIKNEYQKRRDIVYSTLQKIPGIVCEKPSGAFYLVAKLPVEDAEKFVIWMLEEFEVDGETIMLSPAEGFYATPGLGKDEVRIAYVLNSDDMERAMYILKKGLEKYNS
jgi:aspartate aminotransferase